MEVIGYIGYTLDYLNNLLFKSQEVKHPFAVDKLLTLSQKLKIVG